MVENNIIITEVFLLYQLIRISLFNGQIVSINNELHIQGNKYKDGSGTIIIPMKNVAYYTS